MFDQEKVAGAPDSAFADVPLAAPNSADVAFEPTRDPSMTRNDGSVAALLSALRLTLKAADADLASLMVGDRLLLWSSKYHSSKPQTNDAATLFASAKIAEAQDSRSAMLFRWLLRQRTIKVPVNKAHDVYLVTSRRKSRMAFSTKDKTCLEDAGKIIIGLIDRVLARYLTRALAATTDAARMGIIIIDDNSRVIFANTAAKQFMKQGGGVRMVDRRLVGICGSDSTAIRNCFDNIEDTTAIPIRRDDGSVSPVAVSRLELPGRRAYALFLDDPEKPSPPPAWLQNVYHMTPREAEVSALLADGLNVSEVAKELGLSEATVKSYCKDIFAKLDVRRKPDLVRQLSCSPLSIAAPRPATVATSPLVANDRSSKLASAS